MPVMLLLLVAGLFAVVAPSWFICAIGLSDWEEDDAALWVVRVVGLLMAVVPLCLMFRR
jgi:hypothetical protein